MDLILQVGPETECNNLEADSSVLEKESAWFKSILSGRWALEKTEDGKLIVKLPKDNPEDFKLFLELLNDFKGLKLETFDEYETVAAIQELADRYEVAKLQKNLIDWLNTKVEEKVTPETLIEFYERAKDNRVKGLREAICDFVVKNINTFWHWKSNQWLKLDEFAIKLILSDDRTYHGDCFRVYRETPKLDFESRLLLGRFDYSPDEEPTEVKCESRNELLILGKAMEWIDSNGTSSGKSELALRILQHVRFGRMNDGDIVKAIRKARNVLTTMLKGEILEFKLLAKADRDKSSFGFKPDDQPRSLPLTPYKQKVCRKCFGHQVTTFNKIQEGEDGYSCKLDEEKKYTCEGCGDFWGY